jgi:hypothetical protein
MVLRGCRVMHPGLRICGEDTRFRVSAPSTESGVWDGSFLARLIPRQLQVSNGNNNQPDHETNTRIGMELTHLASLELNSWQRHLYPGMGVGA